MSSDVSRLTENEDLLRLAHDLSSESAALDAGISPSLHSAVCSVIAGVDCIHSHLLDGVVAPVAVVAQALDLDPDADGSLLRSASAHIAVRRLILRGRFDHAADLARSVRTEFARRRLRETVNGKPSSPDRADDGHSLTETPLRAAVVAAVAALHRALTRSLGDGVILRLQTDAMLRRAGVRAGLWSLSRGFARTGARYCETLAMPDGDAAEAFCRYALATALDEVRSMRTLIVSLNDRLIQCGYMGCRTPSMEHPDFDVVFPGLLSAA